jgi:O-6-methylguanine DNA methyltransferase
LATDFQKRVWKEIDKIPYGKTVTYKEIAEKIDKPNASRAVANACGRNPSPVIRPCHRVIRTDGSIGGYSASGGAKMKMKLLKKERANS